MAVAIGSAGRNGQILRKNRTEPLELCWQLAYLAAHNFEFLIRLAVENWGK